MACECENFGRFRKNKYAMNKIHFPDSLLKYFKYGPYINPARDWMVLIIISAIALTGIIVWNIWVFGTVAQGGTVGAVATSSPPIFSHESLDAIDTIFANRATERMKYETGTYHFADPS